MKNRIFIFCILFALVAINACRKINPSIEITENNNSGEIHCKVKQRLEIKLSDLSDSLNWIYEDPEYDASILKIKNSDSKAGTSEFTVQKPGDTELIIQKRNTTHPHGTQPFFTVKIIATK